jgi:hypothetical protein
VIALRKRWTGSLLAGVLGAGSVVAQQPGFDHTKHSRVFPSCTTCHSGIVVRGAALWPAPATCASCHDGKVQKQVQWQPPREGGRYNLRFDHTTHAAGIAKRPATCVDCHAEADAPWMTVRPPIPERCLECHETRTAHLAVPDTACATCHLPLAQAKRLTVRDVAAFAAPPDHALNGWGGKGESAHGAAAKRGMPGAARCAVCHARDFCLQCHVDAPDQATIQALAPDPRALAIVARLTAPSWHAEPAFLGSHGGMARRAAQQCSTCHTRESCIECHASRPGIAAKLPAAGGGRGTGAVIVRRPPPSHGESFVERHAAVARAGVATCNGCHVRADCLECHRPDAARAAGYHPAGFLVRHPAAAYARATSCNDCHNSGSFCTSCHARAGLSVNGALRHGYHDANQLFIAGHGGAARQSLETCVSCHVERDCLTCHSALGGRHLSPHGPGFDAARLIKKNPQMCAACHGSNIPTQ